MTVTITAPDDEIVMYLIFRADLNLPKGKLVALAENYRTMAVLDDADRQRNLRMAERIDRALEG